MTKAEKFGDLMGSYQEGRSVVEIYLDGNQIYHVKNGKIIPDRTFHVDDLEEVLAAVTTVLEK